MTQTQESAYMVDFSSSVEEIHIARYAIRESIHKLESAKNVLYKLGKNVTMLEEQIVSLTVMDKALRDQARQYRETL